MDSLPSIDVPMLNSFLHVYIGTMVMLIITLLGPFDQVHVELGFSHYAEKTSVIWRKLSSSVIMPWNTIVNFGYVFLGFYWLCKINLSKHKIPINNDGAYMFYVFAWMAIFYGHIQLARIMTQRHRTAVMDQWYTLPLFGWVPAWCLFTLGGPQWQTFFMIVSSSICSYALSLFLKQGFEIALGVHIFTAVGCGSRLLQIYAFTDTNNAFWMAIACCGGFVILKVIDHDLAKIHPIFQYISGHFLSKICDIFQVHFVMEFFYSISQNSLALNIGPWR